MAVHHGGKVGKAAKILASKSSSNTAKSKAGTPWQTIRPQSIDGNCSSSHMCVLQDLLKALQNAHTDFSNGCNRIATECFHPCPMMAKERDSFL